MNKASQNKHERNLRKMFPDSMIRTTQEFYCNDDKEGGLWTSFLEDGTIDEYGHDNSGFGYWVDPKLQKYLEKHDLWFEPYDPGTLMIWDD